VKAAVCGSYVLVITTRREAEMTQKNDTFLPAREVWQRYGVTSMSLHRWVRDEKLRFPAPVYIGRFRYWRLADLEAWERERPVGRAA
jgi:predicted DNA-binding transcriptional regulator AlpA